MKKNPSLAHKGAQNLTTANSNEGRHLTKCLGSTPAALKNEARTEVFNGEQKNERTDPDGSRT
jgi:hypothetical protein